MKTNVYFIAILYLLLAVSGSLYGNGENTIRLSGDSLWRNVDHRFGITEVSLVRPHPVLVLSSARDYAGTADNGGEYTLDLSISFDEGNSLLFNDSSGHYRLHPSQTLVAVDRRHARAGHGAVLFPGASAAGMAANHSALAPEADSPGTRNSGNAGSLVIESRHSAALFSPNNRIYDFSVEFWLHPLNMENGEEVLLWTSIRPVQGNSSFQRILCVSSRNRLQWTFLNFFISPDGNRSLNIDLWGISAVVPGTWSHHLIRFDSGTGLIEYLVNGVTEAIEYATVTGHEGGEVFTPVTGEGGSFVLGGNFMGLMDEFKIHNAYINSPMPRKYPLRGGRIETAAIDLGEMTNTMVRIEASGGRTSIQNAQISSEYRRNGPFRFADSSEMQFFFRTSHNPHLWDAPWQPIVPNTDLSAGPHGRFVQLAVDFYPSSNGESSPYLEELRIVYLPDPPPLPPGNLTAVALDGAVQLHWRNSPNLNTQGYLVFYGTSNDNFFGEGAVLGASPIDAGNRNSILIEGLQNGVLYYFRVAAYGNSTLHAGEFSREVRARPLQGLAGQ